MAKQGMARIDRTHVKPRNEVSPVPQIQGRARAGHEKANPIVGGTQGASQKVWHTERPISNAYREIDNDLARDNMENDMPDGDLQDL